MKEEFKKFACNHPELINFVNKNEMTWQKFYDMYSLYGEKSEVWDNYFKEQKETKSSEKTISSATVSDIVEMIKKVDIDSVQKNITTINKALNLISSLIAKDTINNDHVSRPLYKKFED